MIKNIKVVIALIILSFVSFSCKDEGVQEQSKLFQQLIKTETGIIRGVNINDQPLQIKKREKKRALVEQSPKFLAYEYEINEHAFIVVAYHFDDKGCSEISVDTYFDSPEQTKEALAIYQEYFTKKYGNPIVEDKLYLWKNKVKTISVELDYLDMDDGEMMLTVYATE